MSMSLVLVIAFLLTLQTVVLMVWIHRHALMVALPAEAPVPMRLLDDPAEEALMCDRVDWWATKARQRKERMHMSPDAHHGVVTRVDGRGRPQPVGRNPFVPQDPA